MSFPNYEFWMRLLGSIAAQTAVVLGLVFALQIVVRAAAWRRALWQIGMASLLILMAAELSGLGRGIGAMIWGKTQQEYKVSVEISPVPAAPEIPAAVAPKDNPPTPFRAVPRSAVWWPGFVWGCGIGVVLLRVAIAQGLFLALRFRRSKDVSPELAVRTMCIAGRLEIPQSVQMTVAPGLGTPVAFGVFKPCVGVPPDFESAFSREQQDAMLAHELAHLAARDPLWYFVTDLVTACLWWHPLVWWARRRLHAASELAADEATVILDNGPVSLAECLVQLGKEIVGRPRWAWMGVDGGFRSTLGQRVQRLLVLEQNSISPAWRGPHFLLKAGLVPALSLGIVFTTGWLQGQGITKQDRWQATLKQSWERSAGATLAMAALEPRSENSTEQTKASEIGSQRLYGKTFKVDADVLDERFGPLRPGSMDFTNAVPTLRALFARAGIDLSTPGRTILYNSGTSEMFVRASLDDLITIKHLLEPSAAEAKNASQPDADANVALQLERVKMLYDNHCCLDAEMLLRAVDRNNKDAQYYRNLVESARAAQLAPPAGVGENGDTSTNSPGLYSRNYQTDPVMMQRQVLNSFVTLNPTDTSLGLRALFAEAGVDFSIPGKSFLYIPSNGTLLVRASLADLELIESVLDLLNRAPPQMCLETKFFEVDEVTAQEFSGPIGITNISTINTVEASGSFTRTSVTNSITGRGTILTWPQVKDAQGRLAKLGGEIVTVPKVTTLSGRQAHIGLQDQVSFAGKTVAAGMTIDIIPRLAVDGYTLKLLLIITQTKPVDGAAGQPPTITENMMLAKCSVRDSLTVVLQGVSSTDPSKRTLAFITPTLIDPAGNRLHTDTELETISAK